MWGDQKCIFLVSKQEVYGKERKRKEKKRKKEKQIQGMDSCIHDFGMIFVQEFLGMIVRVLLGTHPNSRIKGRLVENP